MGRCFPPRGSSRLALTQPGCCTGPRCSCPLWPLSHARRRFAAPFLSPLLGFLFFSSWSLLFPSPFPFYFAGVLLSVGQRLGVEGAESQKKVPCVAVLGLLPGVFGPPGPPLVPPCSDPRSQPHTGSALALQPGGRAGGVRGRLHNPSRARGNPLPGKAAGKACEERERGWEESARLRSWGCSRRFVHRGQRGAELLLSRGGCRGRGQGAAEGPER